MEYIDFGVAKYALADVCEALWQNGVHNAFLTKEDGDIHVRWEYDINRNVPRQTTSENDGVVPEILK